MTTQQGESFLDSLNDAVRTNPVAAGLIGMGALWMLMGPATPAIGRGLSNGVRRAADAAGSATQSSAEALRGASAAGAKVTDSAREVGSTIAETATEVASGVGEMVADGYETATKTASTGLERVVGSAESGAQSAKRKSQEIGGFLTEQLKEAFERQPLLIGAAGLLVGAGIASAFSTTSIENRAMGETATSLKVESRKLINEATDAAKSKAKTVIDEVKQEAENQGLTQVAARAAVSEVVNKAKKVASSAKG